MSGAKRINLIHLGLPRHAEEAFMGEHVWRRRDPRHTT